MHNFETLVIFKMNNRAANINLETITHEESLICPVAGGNCINWILGHIIVSRDDMREVLGMEKASSEELLENYSRGTKTITKERAINFPELLNMFNDLQEPMEKKIESADLTGKQEDLKQLTFLCFHEAYHAGQLGLLRRIAGKSGAIK